MYELTNVNIPTSCFSKFRIEILRKERLSSKNILQLIRIGTIS